MTVTQSNEIRKTFVVQSCERKEIKEFIETWHYSQSINGLQSTHCFQMLKDNQIIGAAIFGGLAMHNQWKRFASSQNDVIELRRLCCIDNTPKNTESFFIGQMLRWLKKNTEFKVVVSYADAEFGHQGTIYKASNFQKLDFRKGAKVIDWNGKRYHDKSLRTKYKGDLKPFAVRLKNALDIGEAHYVETKGKFTYIYDLRAQGVKNATV
jgi:hypothetical protein